MMRILHVNTEKTQRGGERQTILLAKALLDRGIESAILCGKDYPLEDVARRERINTIPVRNGLEAVKRLIVDGGHYDIIHSHAAKAQGQAAIARVLTGKPHVYTRRVTFRPGKLFPTRLKYRLTDKVVCVSKAVKKILMDNGISEEKLFVIYDAVPEKKELNRVRAEKFLSYLGIPKGGKVVGNIAALTPEKDHNTILYAAAEVRDAYFIIFGSGVLMDKLQRTVYDLNLSDRVFLVGFKEDVEDFFAVFDVFVLPSLEEGLANVVIDAFHYHVPVVATPSGGLSELVIDGQTGMLIPVRNYKALAEKVSYILAHPEEAERLCKNAYAFGKEKFNYEWMVNEYIDIYNDCLGHQVK